MTNPPPQPADSPAIAFQYVAVPAQHVPAVYRLLADLASTPSATSELPSSPTAFEWTDDLLSEIAAGRWTTTKVLTDVMDALAKHPNEWYSQDELADMTGRTKSQLLVVWTKLGPHLEKHYETTVWPVETKNGRNLTPVRASSIHYSMTPAMAKKWVRVRGL